MKNHILSIYQYQLSFKQQYTSEMIWHNSRFLLDICVKMFYIYSAYDMIDIFKSLLIMFCMYTIILHKHQIMRCYIN